MNLGKIQAIARAVLYEGFILYPYRATSVKNQQRWTFGGIYPREYAERGGGDACEQQTQCLVEGDADALLEVRVRTLHLIERTVGALAAPKAAVADAGEEAFTPVGCLEVDGRRYYAWQEAVERDVIMPPARLGALAAQKACEPFALTGDRAVELLRNADGLIAGNLIRTRRTLRGMVTIATERLRNRLWRVTVRTENLTPLETGADRQSNDVSLLSMASTHTVLGVQSGAFVSLIDPPVEFAVEAASCSNRGCFPVLVGEPGERDTLLSSPIILYDYPQIAAESPGDLFDGTEIDEMLSLRILAMTDAEKREMAELDPTARALLERTEALTEADMQRMHGALRNLRALDSSGNSNLAKLPRLAAVNLGGRSIQVGDRVRLKPRPGGDIMDLALNGKTAIVEAIERDFEDRVHIAVAVDDDPGRDLGLARMPGHRFFFSPQEVELLGADTAEERRP